MAEITWKLLRKSGRAGLKGAIRWNEQAGDTRIVIYSLRFFAIFLALATCVLADNSVPDWSKKTFAASAEQVFAAALKSIAAQHYEVKSKDDVNRVINFHVGASAWSWGYLMALKVSANENNASLVSIEIVRLRSPDGKVSLVADGKKEVQKISAGIEKELAKAPPMETK